MLKRLICLLLCICLCAAAPALAENVGESLVVGMIGSATYRIRPLEPLERSMVSLYALVYESLVTVDDQGIVQPYLAESWTQAGGTITFTLRDDIRFSDGTPVTAEDVAASGNYLIDLAKSHENSSEKGFYQNMTYSIKNFTTNGEKSVVAHCNRDYYGALYNCAFPVVKAGEVAEDNPVGSGPYVISTFLTGDLMLLDANPEWWQLQPQVKQISVSFFPNNKELMNAYEFGRVDTIFTRNISAAQYKSGSNSISMSYTTRQLEMLLLNTASRAFPLNDPDIRRAVRYAINVTQISNAVYMGMTDRAYTTVHTDSWLYLDQESDYVYNPDKAREILTAKGWYDYDGNGILDYAQDDSDDLKHLRLSLYVYEDPENDLRIETANLIADMLGEVGFDVHVETGSYDEVYSHLKENSFDMALCAIQMDVNPDPGFMLLSGNDMNFGRYKSTEMKTLINTMRESEGQSSFYQSMQAVQQQLAADTPFVALFFRTGAVLSRKMYTTVRDIREYELLRGIESFGR